MFYILDMKSFEYMSPSELDRKFFGEQSLLSALSLEQLSTSRLSNEMAADVSDARLSTLALRSISSDPIPSPQAISTNNQDTCHLTVPLPGKSSTPYMFQRKQEKAVCSNQSFSEFTTPQISWDVSLIKSESNSPKPCIDSSALESTWSPKPQSTKHSLAEVSP